ncbi:MAG: hypothetical protein J1F02_12295 [Lachnospiraceae bacterium]|nr:hypothetical protein [Lachnospiraceae bacterium]
MNTKTPIVDSAVFDGSKLWDEILKAIVGAMPSQLFPLFKEVYGKEYPKDTPIVVLGTETTSFQENPKAPPGSTLMDIALLVAGSDYYHLECQMENDQEMVIRMFAYDVRFAITHTKFLDENTGELTLHFPHSAVIYPEKNSAIPNYLKCRVIFQDNSEHIYKIPTVKIQTYSLEEIHKKHLTLFIPYSILRLRPKLKSKKLLTLKELTEFINEAILVLKEELHDEYLSEQEYRNYLRLFFIAVDRVLTGHPQLQEEVYRMTEPLIKLPSVVEDELWEKICGLTGKIADLEITCADMRAKYSDMKAAYSDMETKYSDMETKYSDMETKNINQESELVRKDAEIERLRQKINELSSKQQ